MQVFNIRDLQHLFRHKIILLLIIAMPFSSSAQNDPSENLIDYDELWIHYGFALSLHSARYKIQMADAFETQDSLHSVVPGHLPGWKVGMIVNMRLLQYLDLRTMLTVAFYEQDLTYRYTDGSFTRHLKDATLVELPVLLKYKSARRGNVAMYTLGGFTTALEAAGKGDEFDTREKLELRNWNFAVEAGIGFDLYYPLFKFSPEVRYSWGVRNMLIPGRENSFSAPLKRLTYQNIAFYLTFEGGPTYLKDNSKRRKRRR